MLKVRLKETVKVANGLGECILWDTVYNQVLWTDIPGKALCTYEPVSGSISCLNLPEELFSFALIEGSDELLCAFKSGFALLDRHSGERHWLMHTENAEKIFLNDGRVDRKGRFWVGSLIDNETNLPCDGLSGELYRVDADGSVSKHLDGLGIANSLCWSPDGRTMYLADTPLRTIYAFDYDSPSDTLGEKRTFAVTPENTGPDGSTIDADGFLWNAEWGEGRVVRYAPDGTVAGVLQLPVSHVACVAFGGETFSDLYVTTATFGLTDPQRQSEPQAGDVFVFGTPFRGLPECRFVNRIPRNHL